MADRIITSSAISSDSLNDISDAAERLFWRIVASDQTDAWGRRDGSARKLRADCIPLLEWDDEKLIRAVEELVRNGLGELYFVEGRCYFRVCNWDRYQRTLVRLRRGRSRFPDPVPDEEDTDSSGERAASERRASGERAELISGSSSNESLPTADQSVQSRGWLNEEDFSAETAEPESLGWFVSRIPGATSRTPAAIATLVRKYKLPVGALHAALSELEAAQRAEVKIKNPPGLVVTKLKEYGESGRFAR